MDIALWIAQGVLASAFLMAGMTKIVKDREFAIEKGQGYAEDFSDPTLTFIGVMEVLGALGLVLPVVFDTATFLVPWAAVGLAIGMLGAMTVHARRGGEGQMIAVNLGLFALAAFVAWGRFGDYAV